jgi:acyl-coenzyme A thioesterase PaaI-like protein
MSQPNKIAKMVKKVQSLPMGKHLLTLAMGKMIPYVGFSGLEVVEMTEDVVTIRVQNRLRTRNHIGQVHAAAMILVAESASGLVVGMNVSDSSLPLIKTLNTKFIRRSKGAITATARLTPEQKLLFAQEKGDLPVDVTVTDESGNPPILVEAIWAWVPNRKKA